MAHFGHVISVEPFEEATQSQGDSESTATSPDALNAFYAKMERQEILERKMSRTQSSAKRSLWSRKSTKKQLGAPVNIVPALGKLSYPTDSDQPPEKEKRLEEEKDSDMFDDKTNQLLSSLSRSIIPDALGELPAWFIKENESAIGQTTSHRIKYPIHSPFGPRYYKNQHLIPSSQLRAAARPPSVFSPSFPPMAASHDQPEDLASRPGLSRTPSGSPLATPNSSQADVAVKPRSRKTSQTTPDTVDLLDVTDPWGTHYHHQSPYDPGLTSSSSHGSHGSPVEADAPESPMSPRSRRSSMTAGQPRRKTVTPSPLSQSTSALHMPTPEIAPQLKRKLSKRRKPLMGGLFGGQDKDTDESVQQAASAPRAASAPLPHAESAPVTPVDAPTTTRSSTMPNGLHPAGDLHKRHSSVPPSMSPVPHGPPPVTHHLGEKKEKRGSVLGRLAKKLSIMKRPPELVRGSVGSTDEWQHIGMGDAQSDRNSGRSAILQRHSMQERPLTEQRKTDLTKRVPPPAVGLKSSSGAALDAPTPHHSDDHESIVSLEPPLAMGKLTIANPDSPSSADNTPVGPNIPLPTNPEPVPEMPQRPRVPQDSTDRPKSTLPPLPDSAAQATATPAMPSTSTAELPPAPPSHPSPAEMLQSPTSTDPMTLYPTYINGLSSPSVIPFPMADQRPLSSISTSARATVASSPLSFMDDSPLSRASMIVNPPTPHNPTVPMAPTPVVPTNASRLAIAPVSERPSRNPSPPKADASKPKIEATRSKADIEVKDESQRGSTPVTSRQTETFKLIRTASGNVLPANETITAGGEHWEVVESSDSSKKNKTKERSSRSKDRDTGVRREQRRQGQSAPQETEAEQHRTRQRSFNDKEVDQPLAVPPSTKSTRSHSMDIPRPNQEDSKHSRKESKPNLDKPQPPPPPPTPGPSRVERKPSTTTRPTSELASAAELNALRAREAWDMDRLWKGRSMYYPEPGPKGMVSAPPQTQEPIIPSVSVELTRDNGTVRSSGHGSSHTSFMVQPFQSQAPANMYYSNMPSAPPPTIYSPTALQQAPFPSSPPYDYSQTYRSFPPSFSPSFSLPPPDPLPEISTRPNPLPPPPRESSYQPSPLPPLSDASGRSNADHWTRHPGVTTAH